MFLVANVVNAQLVIDISKYSFPGTIVLKDGSKMSGVIKIPDNESIKQKPVKIEMANKEKKEIEASRIAYFEVYHPKNETKKYKFIAIKNNQINGYKVPKKEKPLIWIAEMETSKKAKTYGWGINTTLKKNGFDQFSKDWFPIRLITMDNGKTFSQLGFSQKVINGNSTFKIYAKNVFVNCPSLLEKIKSKEFNYLKMQLVLDFYDTQCK